MKEGLMLFKVTDRWELMVLKIQWGEARPGFDSNILH